MTGARLPAIDWMRGIVMVLMTIDHASSSFNAGRLVTDSALWYQPGMPLPATQFFLRWVTHLCAPSFVFLAGVALCLSVQRRLGVAEDARSIDRHLVTRGLLIALLDPLYIGIFFGGGRFPLQVLYAIGMSMVTMALLRRLSSRWLLAIAIGLIAGGELLERAVSGMTSEPSLLGGLLLQAMVGERIQITYPLLPWLSFMILGWVCARYFVRRGWSGHPSTVSRLLLGLSVVLLSAFLIVRGINGYGNMSLLRENGSLVQWLHVCKYPPSLSFAALELAIMCLVLSLLFAIAARRAPNSDRNPILVFGQTPLFFYLLHIPLLELSAEGLGVYRTGGIPTAVVAAGVALLIMYPLCLWYRNYKRSHPNSVVRYI